MCFSHFNFDCKMLAKHRAQKRQPIYFADQTKNLVIAYSNLVIAYSNLVIDK
jgi:hypothetical protein